MQTRQSVYSGPAKSRVFSYLRWSSDRQTWGDSERRQNEAAEQWCARHGLTLAGQEIDQGVSAYHGHNLGPDSGLNRLLKRMGASDVLLIEDNDRFSRKDTVAALTSLRAVVNKGVRVIFLKTGVEVTADNFNEPSVLFPNFFQGYLANAESVKKAARVKASWAARKAAISQGSPINQNLPSWLRWDAAAKQVLVIPERAEVVRTIFRLYNGGLSIRPITQKLTLDGVPCISKQKNGHWTINYVGQLLRSRSVIGDCLHTNPPTPGIFPAIVTEKEFYAAQSRLDVAHHFTGPRGKSVSNLVKGLAVCSKCGAPMNKITYRRIGKTERAYLVCGAAQHGSSDCGRHGMRYDVFEQSLLSLNGASLLKALAGDKAPSPVDALKTKLASVQAQCNGWMRSIEGQTEISPRILAALKVLEKQESDLLAEITTEEAKAKAARPPEDSLKAFRAEVEQPAVKVNRTAAGEALRGFVEKIVCNPEEQAYTVHFKGGSEPMNVALIKV